MSEELPVRRTRTVLSPTPPAKLLVLIGVLLAVFAGYLAFSPLERTTKDGRPVSCGTAFKQSGPLTRLTCGQANVQRQWQAGGVLAAAVIVAFGGMWVYGGSRRIVVERTSRVVTAELSAAAPPDEPREPGTL
ncbi:MAG: hypothetical protein ACHQE5_13205 [Actinomycetes bacterium]